jgi:hypothetical protein
LRIIVVIARRSSDGIPIISFHLNHEDGGFGFVLIDAGAPAFCLLCAVHAQQMCVSSDRQITGVADSACFIAAGI